MAEETLVVKKDRVIAASKQCPDAARILKELFPEAFTEKDLKLENSCSVGGGLRVNGAMAVEVRQIGNLRLKGFYLDPAYKWRVEQDNGGCCVLIPYHPLDAPELRR